MNESFEKKVWSAAIAGWWTILIAFGFLLLQWVAYLAIMDAKPAWVLCMCGPDITWPFLQNVWIWFVGVLKLCLWLLTLVVLWLTFWAWQLRKRLGNP
jgi:hypothetical protein